jgi:hypothetical protein
MRSRRISFISIVALLVTGGWVAGAAPIATAATCWGRYGPPVDPGDQGLFYGAAALNATSTWAVGYVGQVPLVEHWDGCNWKIQRSEAKSGKNVGSSWLTSVAAVSSTFQWAVGAYVDSSAGYRGFIERGDGSTWSIVTSPTLLHYSYYEGVDTISAKNAWAVGNYDNGSATVALVAHWDGTSWKRQNAPNPGTTSGFKSVSALAGNNVWAAGYYHDTNGIGHTLIEHWNGSQWKVVPSPNAVGMHNNNSLDGIFMLSATNGWAVGDFNDANAATQTLILHWNGSTWKISKSPNPGGALHNHFLNAVVATSPTNAWTVGSYATAPLAGKSLLEHWDGKTWAVQTIAGPGGANRSFLYDIAASSASNAWAVGASGQLVPYAVHCC